jgi:uncharacterized protein YcfJ
METKSLVWLGLGIGSVIGSVIGGILDHGNFLGAWSIILGAVGSFAGIYIGYKIGNDI